MKNTDFCFVCSYLGPRFWALVTCSFELGGLGCLGLGVTSSGRGVRSLGLSVLGSPSLTLNPKRACDDGRPRYPDHPCHSVPSGSLVQIVMQ